MKLTIMLIIFLKFLLTKGTYQWLRERNTNYIHFHIIFFIDSTKPGNMFLFFYTYVHYITFYFLFLHHFICNV